MYGWFKYELNSKPFYTRFPQAALNAVVIADDNAKIKDKESYNRTLVGQLKTLNAVEKQIIEIYTTRYPELLDPAVSMFVKNRLQENRVFTDNIKALSDTWCGDNCGI